MLSVRGLTRAFGTKQVLNGTSFDLPEGCIAGMIGPSGGGKSVLLKILGGTCRSDGGTYDFGPYGHDDVGLMFQEGALFDSLSVFDNVAFPLVKGCLPCSILPSDRRDDVTRKVSVILDRVGLTKAAQKMPAQISGGMRRRVSLARALVGRPRILLLDDPTAGLDPVASSIIMNLIVEFQLEYRPMTLLVSHDLRRLLPAVDLLLGLFDGQIRFQGSLESLRRRSEPDIRQFISCRFPL